MVRLRQGIGNQPPGCASGRLRRRYGPLAVAAGVVHGSYDGNVYLLPLGNESRFAVQTPGDAGPWIGLAVVGVLFVAVVLPCVLMFARPRTGNP